MLSRSPLLVLVPMLLYAVLALPTLLHGDMPDLFIYRGGAWLGGQGESPYAPRISELVKAQWPENEDLIANCGFFLPPQAIVLFGPFAALPWFAAKLLYTLLTLAALAACWYGLMIAFRTPPRLGWPPIASVPWPLAWLMVLHLITIMTYKAGQTTILCAAAIVLGQLAHERGRPYLGGFLWAVAFIKPHIALPLLPLAIYFSGWKRGAILLGWLALLNLAGCLIAAGTPLFAFDYLHYLRDAHDLVRYNQVEANYQITSWNRLAFSLGFTPVKLTVPWVLAGYALFAVLIAVRCFLARCRPSQAWLLAVSMTAAIFCCQVLAYESFLLVLVVPYILECLENGRRRLAMVLIAMLVAHMLPLELMLKLGLDSYRTWLVASLAVTLLAAPPDASAKRR